MKNNRVSHRLNNKYHIMQMFPVQQYKKIWLNTTQSLLLRMELPHYPSLIQRIRIFQISRIIWIFLTHSKLKTDYLGILLLSISRLSSSNSRHIYLNNRIRAKEVKRPINNGILKHPFQTVEVAAIVIREIILNNN